MNIDKIFNTWDSDYKSELLEVLNYNFSGKGLDELIDFIENSINDSGAIDEIIERQIDIYYYDLREWSVDNYEYIEQYVDEFGVGDKSDFHSLIQGGQYVYFSEQINKALSDMVNHIHGAYNV